MRPSRHLESFKKACMVTSRARCTWEESKWQRVDCTKWRNGRHPLAMIGVTWRTDYLVSFRKHLRKHLKGDLWWMLPPPVWGAPEKGANQQRVKCRKWWNSPVMTSVARRTETVSSFKGRYMVKCGLPSQVRQIAPEKGANWQRVKCRKWIHSPAMISITGRTETGSSFIGKCMVKCDFPSRVHLRREQTDKGLTVGNEGIIL
jgi:hypothetical protein